MPHHVEIKPKVKTITRSEIKKLLNDGFSVRTQTNGLVFVGEKKEIKIALTSGVNYVVMREDVYRLISE